MGHYHKAFWEPRGNHCVSIRLTYWEVEQLKGFVHGVTSGVATDLEYEDKDRKKLEWLEKKLSCKLACEKVPER